MEISEQTRIAAPLAEVWPLLADPALVAACIPGAELAPDKGDGVWRGSIRVKFGPTAAAFRGEATLAYDHDAHRCTIEGRGIDQRGASRALSHGVIVASEEGADGGSTLLNVDGGFTVTGPLESFANAGGVHLARVLLGEFAKNIAAMVEERRAAASPEPPAEAAPAAPSPAAPAEAAPPPPVQPPPPRPPLRPAREISGFGLLWRALLSWLKSLFHQGNR